MTWDKAAVIVAVAALGISGASAWYARQSSVTADEAVRLSRLPLEPIVNWQIARIDRRAFKIEISVDNTQKNEIFIANLRAIQPRPAHLSNFEGILLMRQQDPNAGKIYPSDLAINKTLPAGAKEKLNYWLLITEDEPASIPSPIDLELSLEDRRLSSEPIVFRVRRML